MALSQDRITILHTALYGFNHTLTDRWKIESTSRINIYSKSIKYYTKGQNLLSGGNLLVHSITGTITAIDQEIFEQII